MDITDSNFGYGPASATCDAASGGPGCKFVSFDFSGKCKTVQEVDPFEVSECTVSGPPTILFLFSSSGAHDQIAFFDWRVRSIHNKSHYDI